ncbi:uncharacterized protein LOC121380365 [Gigantopelta aegis]|uniref:uncharacterized protein LOC121380365 n=1 Tax=Gigantopelta aegis TaxID=1735272 RepID=UPI001B88984D|nr:uncharacterized protein LOC121380365 [Gigantopelta aegis]
MYDEQGFFERYRKHLREKSRAENNGCVFWTGAVHKTGRSGSVYGAIRVQLPGTCARRTIGVHRLAFMIDRGQCYIARGLEVSHLCHQQLCIAGKHLNLEPPSVNKNRNICKHIGRCKGHVGYPKCVM